MIDVDPREFWLELIKVLDEFDMADLAERGWTGDRLAEIYFYICERENRYADHSQIAIG